jgi:CHAT domain-containing protein/tetratricopeptide (TPR) repeat protein
MRVPIMKLPNEPIFLRTFPSIGSRRISLGVVCLAVAFLLTGSWAQELSSGHRQAYERCRSLQTEGNWREAREVAADLVRQFQSEPDSRFKLAFANELANLNQRLGDYGEASEGYRECLRLANNLSSEQGTIHAQLKNNLAALYQVLGQFDEAEVLARESLELRRRVDGNDSEKIVPALNNLAGLFWCIGDLVAAESHYREALTIRESKLGGEARETALSQANLGGLLFYRDRVEEAEPLVRRAVVTLKTVSGPDHPDTLDALLFLGEIERAKGDPERALAIYRDCVDGRVRAFGTSEHVEVAEAERRVGDALREAGRYEESLKSYADSERHYQAVLRPEHLDLLEGTYGAGLSALASGDRQEALRQAASAQRIERNNLEAILRFTDERQRLAYQDMFRSVHLLANLEAATELAEFQILTKGVVLDSLIREVSLLRESSDPRVAAGQEAVRAARARFRTAFLGREQPGNEAELLAATRSMEELIRSLRTQIGGDAEASGVPTASLQEIQGALGEGDRLVDYLVYDRYLGEAKTERHYGAIVLSRTEVRFHRCGPAAPIDDFILQLAPLFANTKQIDDELAGKLMRQLFNRLIEPLRPSLDGAARLLISPADRLTFVPFGCLIDGNDRFLVESYGVGYLSTARSVLVKGSGRGRSREAVLIGNPAYGAPVGETGAGSRGSGRGMIANYGAAALQMVASHLIPLPGTDDEVNQLAAMLESGGMKVTVLKEDRATERALMAGVSQPAILHFATHGVYLGVFAPHPEDVRRQPGFAPDELAGFHNPMFESWLALSGSKGTVNEWAIGRSRPAENDGILMANEAAELDLAGTLLVTLSACDTAAGEATRGDGVLGLRRGFQLAGAANVMTTLWPINDFVTVEIMKAFYGSLASSEPEAALSRVQREWLPQLRKEEGLHRAISYAGPFMLSR